ncbi:carboxymuconolactone decarboxylase family protein [Epilithonimonas hungarica]|uniref:Alkylhydroperoxidase AhpD family core domain-containing protein n=1 Tax=Epilithonimonas hungarica TaxID=454006 RepID=A0A1G7SSF6_9FLAO|nr:carboxymuconolactone decarboxylase family protein [Epilithonimonas hungarica]SDG25210.1 alkylhydroperoxidase AhpD family core domain-containing protein [Epilithonimonas hungarica]
MSKRLNLKELIPESYQILLQMSQFVANSGVDKLQQELIKIRASQINGCAYCMNLHSEETLKLGENPKRLHVLSAWREAKDWFSNEDQVILKITEEITLISNHGLSDTTYQEAVELFGELMTAKIIISVININALNRVGVSLNMHPL